MKITDYLYNLVYTQHSGGQFCGQKGTNSKLRIELMNITQKGLRFNIYLIFLSSVKREMIRVSGADNPWL